MNLTRNPQLLDQLAAAYALGSLRGGARRRFEQLAREYPQVRASALLWQGRWSAFAEVQAPVRPDAAVWTRIHNLVKTETSNAQWSTQRQATTSRKSACRSWPCCTKFRSHAMRTVHTLTPEGVVRNSGSATSRPMIATTFSMINNPFRTLSSKTRDYTRIQKPAVPLA